MNRPTITAPSQGGQGRQAVENFKRAFDPGDPAQGKRPSAHRHRLLIVCDMPLTGFDAPIEQVMYVDKGCASTTCCNHRPGQPDGRRQELRLHRRLHRPHSSPARCPRHLRRRESAGPCRSRWRASTANCHPGAALSAAAHLFGPRPGEIDDFVQQRLEQPPQEYAVLQRILDLLEDIKPAGRFRGLFQEIPAEPQHHPADRAGNPYRGPARRFGYLLGRSSSATKDDLLDLRPMRARRCKPAHQRLPGEPGYRPGQPHGRDHPTPLSVQHIAEHSDLKAKASEMEHAIRKHCKVHLKRTRLSTAG